MSTIDNQAEFVFAKARAQRSATLVQLGALAGAVVCIGLAALLHEPINRQRRDLQLVTQSELYKELPPKYAWISAVGGPFRGIAADFLWTRAEGLKEEGRYYELHQLAKWICTLQPRFAAVWSFQAWNMSYNISVATHTTRERWQWVYNGIRLLRDEGIPNNEKVVELYRQLAWTWFHKVGERLDDYHLKYKRFWATYMEVLLGPFPSGGTDEEQINYIRPVVDAPPTLDGLLAKRPAVANLVDQLKGIGVDVTVGTNPNHLRHPLELSFFEPYTKWQREKRLAAFRKSARKEDERTMQLFKFFDGAPPDDLLALVNHLRSRVLREQYKMDPKLMQDMTTRLGDKPVPIDWRTPWSQAIYWGMYGVQRGRELKNAKEFDLMNTDRVLLFSTGALARQGHYIFRPDLDSPEDSFLDTSPDWRFVEVMHQMCLALGKQHADPGEKVGNTAGEMLRDYHINTLQSAILGLALSGREEQARRYYDYLAQNYPDQFTHKMNKVYENFNDFLQKQIVDLAGTYHDTILMLSALMESRLMSLAEGQYNEAGSKMKSARDLYDAYQKQMADTKEGRMTLPPWEQIQADALGRFVTNPELPLEIRFVVWERIEAAVGGNAIDAKQRCYDQVRSILEEQYGNSDLNLDRAFPAPPGMAEWRKSHPAAKPEDVAQELREEKKEENKKKAEGQ